MLRELRIYLTAQGYLHVHQDLLPAQEQERDVIALSEWQHTTGDISDGTGVHMIQIQVRRRTSEEAERVCRELFSLLDSGMEETPINLTPEVFCIARPRRGPMLMSRDATSTTYYCETALWGSN